MRPPCCFTTISWLIESPSPVPSPGGFVVKKGSNILDLMLPGIPVPLSRMRISTLWPRFRVLSTRVGRKFASSPFPFAIGRCVKAVRNQIEQNARDLLRVNIRLTCFWIENLFQFHVEIWLFRPSAVIGKVEGLLDKRIDGRTPVIARSLARMQQHVLDNRVGPVSMLKNLLQVAV